MACILSFHMGSLYLVFSFVSLLCLLPEIIRYQVHIWCKYLSAFKIVPLSIDDSPYPSHKIMAWQPYFQFQQLALDFLPKDCPTRPTLLKL